MYWPKIRNFLKEFFWCLHVIPWAAKWAQKVVVILEPWAIIIAACSLVVGIVSFWIDYKDRVQERTVQAWQLLTVKVPGNSGKREALEYLNSTDGFRFDYFGLQIPLKEPAPLMGIDLSIDKLDGVELAGRPQGTGVFLREVDLILADLSKANLTRADLRGATLDQAVLSDADLEETELSGAKLNGATLAFANLKNSLLDNVEMNDANLTLAHLKEAELPQAELRCADLFWAEFEGASLNGADLSGAILTGADLSHTGLLGANLTGASLTGANLTGAHLNDETIISQAQLDEACAENIFIPASLNLEIKPCAEVEWYDEIHGDLRTEIGPSIAYSRQQEKEDRSDRNNDLMQCRH